MKTVETRVQGVEKVLGEATAVRSYTHAQLVALASGATPEEVGPPREPVVPGKPTMAELIAEAAARGLPEAPRLVEATDHGAPARLMRAADDEGEVG